MEIFATWDKINSSFEFVVCIKNPESAWRGWDMPDNIFDNSGWDTWNYVQWDIPNWLEGGHIDGVTET